ncbi:MAG: LptA/OstA family protein, partial [Pseudomonadota bacterium]
MHKWTSIFLFAATAAFSQSAWAQDAVPADVDVEVETDDERPRVILDADNIFANEAENKVIAEGNVEAKYEGRVLRADRLTYDRNTDRVRAEGNVVIIDADGSETYAAEIETNSTLADGYAIGFSTRTAEGGVAVAESAVTTEAGYSALEKIVYTSCEVCDEDDNPTWALR